MSLEIVHSDHKDSEYAQYFADLIRDNVSLNWQPPFIQQEIAERMAQVRYTHPDIFERFVTLMSRMNFALDHGSEKVISKQEYMDLCWDIARYVDADMPDNVDTVYLFTSCCHGSMIIPSIREALRLAAHSDGDANMSVPWTNRRTTCFAMLSLLNIFKNLTIGDAYENGGDAYRIFEAATHNFAAALSANSHLKTVVVMGNAENRTSRLFQIEMHYINERDDIVVDYSRFNGLPPEDVPFLSMEEVERQYMLARSTSQLPLSSSLSSYAYG